MMQSPQDGIDPATSPCWPVRIIMAAFMREDGAHGGTVCPRGESWLQVLRHGDGVSSGVFPPVSPVHEECTPAGWGTLEQDGCTPEHR